MTKHIALLGDSVFDNRAYTRGQPEVAAHLRSLLPGGRVTLCAIDGSTTSDLGVQFDRVPADATDIVLSVGGNDALLNADLLDLPVKSTAQALTLFRERVDAFEQSYGYVIEALVHLGRPCVVCTIYNGNLADSEAARARIALMMFNDVILRTALRASIAAIDLRLVCDSPEDFANPIEPSGSGGLKIARAIVVATSANDRAKHRLTVTAG